MSCLYWLFFRYDTKLEEQVLTVLLQYGEMPGLEICDRIKQDFNRRLLGMGSIYPVLHRLEKEGFVASRWGEEAIPERGGARHRYYKLSGKRMGNGRLLLVDEDGSLQF